MKVGQLVLIMIWATSGFAQSPDAPREEMSPNPAKGGLEISIQFDKEEIEHALENKSIPLTIVIKNNPNDMIINQMDDRNNGVVVFGIDENGKRTVLFPVGAYNTIGRLGSVSLGRGKSISIKARIPLNVISPKYKKYIVGLDVIQPESKVFNSVYSEPFLLPDLPTSNH